MKLAYCLLLLLAVNSAVYAGEIWDTSGDLSAPQAISGQAVVAGITIFIVPTSVATATSQTLLSAE